MIELLRKRRSIRKYAAKKINPATIRLLEEALLRAPSSRGLKTCQFIFVDDPLILERLSHCKEHGSDFLASAPLGIVVCADETKSDVWVEDGSIAAIIVQLTAESRGLGACWIQVRNRSTRDGKMSEQVIRENLNIPEYIRVVSIISIGYPAEEKAPIPAEDLTTARLHHNNYRPIRDQPLAHR